MNGCEGAVFIGAEPPISKISMIFPPLLLPSGAVFVGATLDLTGVYLSSSSFFSPGFDSLLATFSKGFLVSTLI